MSNSKKAVITDMTGSPHPAGSSEATMAMIANRAVGGRFAMVERGGCQALVISFDEKNPDVVGCDTFDVGCDDDQVE